MYRGRDLGRAAGEKLLAAIEGDRDSGLHRLPCSLVLRESSRPPDRDASPSGPDGGSGHRDGAAGPPAAPDLSGTPGDSVHDVNG